MVGCDLDALQESIEFRKLSWPQLPIVGLLRPRDNL